MFNKLLANLPFNPSLVNQVAFYGRRLRAESSIRRVGFVVAGLALFVQFLAVISTPNLTQASPANDLIDGGVSSTTQAYNDCQQNSAKAAPNYGSILSYYGISCGDILNASSVFIKSTDDGNNLYTIGQQPANLAGETPTSISGNTYYWRYLWAWDTSSTPTTYNAFKVSNTTGQSFYILCNSGNLVSTGLPTPNQNPGSGSGQTPISTSKGSKPSISVTGTVYYYNGSSSSSLANVPVYNCYNSVTNEASSDSHGQFSFNIPEDTPFCVRAGAPTVPYVWVSPNGTIYSDPVITPNYIIPNAVPSGVKTSCSIIGYNNSTYEFQVAGSQSSAGQCNYDLPANSGYNIAFTKATSPTASTVAIGGTVYYYDSSTKQDVDLVNVPVFNCYNNATDTPSTSANGQFSFKLPAGTSFCGRAGAPSSPFIWVAADGTTYSNPVITPDQIAISSSPTSCGNNSPSYEEQTAGSASSTGTCHPNTNVGYNIEFTKATPPTTIPGAPTTITPPSTSTCEYNPEIASSNSQCKPCISSDTQTDILSCLTFSKSAADLTENIANANGITAQAGDIIGYTLTVKNNATATAQAFVIEENMSDVLDYASPENLNGGTINDSNDTLSWPPVDIPAGATVQKNFTVKIISPVSTALPSLSNPTYFNHTLTNTYGNTVIIQLPISIVQASAQVSQSLPNTGPGSSFIMGGVVMVFIGYLFARSRLLAKESVLIANDFNVTRVA